MKILRRLVAMSLVVLAVAASLAATIAMAARPQRLVPLRVRTRRVVRRD